MQEQILALQAENADLKSRLTLTLELDASANNQELITLKNDIAKALKLEYQDYMDSKSKAFSPDQCERGRGPHYIATRLNKKTEVRKMTKEMTLQHLGYTAKVKVGEDLKGPGKTADERRVDVEYYDQQGNLLSQGHTNEHGEGWWIGGDYTTQVLGTCQRDLRGSFRQVQSFVRRQLKDMADRFERGY
jgi:hypothetical protein